MSLRSTDVISSHCHFEALEPRRLLAAFTVDTATDVVDAGDGLTSLREAIDAANANADADVISFDTVAFSGGGTITLNGTSLSISEAVTIQGASGQVITIDGDDSSRVFDVFAEVTLDYLTITGGSESDGAGINVSSLGDLTITNSTIDGNTATNNGGGIDNSGTLTISNSTISNNFAVDGAGINNDSIVTLNTVTISGNNASEFGGGINNFGSTSMGIYQSTIDSNTAGDNGGGIRFAAGNMTITESTISNNIAVDNGGGMHASSAAATITGVTFSGNSATDNGGGLFNSGSSITDIRNSTFSGNTADIGGGVDNSPFGTLTLTNVTVTGNTAVSGGGGVRNSGIGTDLTLENSIVAGNTSAANADISGAVNTGEFTVVGDASAAGGLTDGVDNNIVGVGGAGVIDINEILDTTLQDNGGITETHRLVANSVALNSGSNGLIGGISTDQRGTGFDRIVYGTIDRGAFELVSLNVDTTVDESDGDYSVGDLSLREALELANLTTTIDEVITFDETIFGAGATITLGGTQLDVSESVSIQGIDGVTIAIDGNNLSRVFNISGAGTIEVSISDLVIRDGNSAGFGGGILVGTNDELTLNDVTVTSNLATTEGGGIFGLSATITINDSFVTANGAGTSGGGIYLNGGELTINDSRVSFNDAFGANADGGGLAVLANSVAINNTIMDQNEANGDGGAIHALGTTLTIDNSVISGSVTDAGSGAGIFHNDSLIVTDTTIRDNSAYLYGGGIYGDNAVNAILHSTISGNSALSGAGIRESTGTIAMGNSTLSGNIATANGGGIFTTAAATFDLVNNTIVQNQAGLGAGGGIFEIGATFEMHNTIVGDNTATSANDLFGTVDTGFNNIIGDATSSGGLTDGVNGNIVGNGGVGTLDLDTVIDGTLQDNGGETFTHNLVAGGPAIDVGSNVQAVNNGLTRDQRNLDRILGGIVDIGAVETTDTFVVDTTDDESDGDFTSGDFSLREAVELANLLDGTQTITFDGVVFAGGGTITLGGSQLDISESVEINGAVGQVVTIDANETSRVFDVDAALANLSLSYLEITGGQDGVGGGAYVDTGATLTIDNVTFTGNDATSSGGAIYNNDGRVEVSNSTISDNTAVSSGGGISSFGGDLIVSDTVISDNSADSQGGGIFVTSGNTASILNTTVSGNDASNGGGLSTFASETVQIVNSTFSGNTSSSHGAGIRLRGGGSTIAITNSTFSGNAATGTGGGVRVETGATLAIESSTFTGNNAAGGNGGGIDVDLGSLDLNNSIIAGNTGSAANDIDGSVNSGSNNLIGQAFGSGGLTDGVDGNIVGVGGTGERDINTILDTTLQNNGGATNTHALVLGSSAIDAGDAALLPADSLDVDGDLNTLETLPLDQAGNPRVAVGVLDIGALEVVNQAPTDLTLDNNTIAEDVADNDPVGTVTVTDINAGDTHTYTLTDDAGGRFAIDLNTGEITVLDSSLIDFETNTSHSVTVEVEDSGSNTYSEDFTINITNVNEAPTDLTLDNDSIPEDTANGGAVGTVSVTDEDAVPPDGHTYSLTDDAGGRFTINSSTGQITVLDTSLIDFESGTSHSITVLVTDSGGLTYSEDFSINITNVVDENPTDLSIDNDTIAEDVTNGDTVGTISVTDPDGVPPDSHTYALTNNAGGRFAIDTNTGEITVANDALIDFETNTSHLITVRVTDSEGLTYDEDFTINITNVNEAPTDLAISNDEVIEIAENGSSVGTVSVTDVDAVPPDSHTYTLTDDAGGRFAINSTTGEVTVVDNTLLDANVLASHSITVEVEDSGGLTYSESFTIDVVPASGYLRPLTMPRAIDSGETLNGLLVSRIVNDSGIDFLAAGDLNAKLYARPSGGGGDILLSEKSLGGTWRDGKSRGLLFNFSESSLPDETYAIFVVVCYDNTDTLEYVELFANRDEAGLAVNVEVSPVAFVDLVGRVRVMPQAPGTVQAGAGRGIQLLVNIENHGNTTIKGQSIDLNIFAVDSGDAVLPTPLATLTDVKLPVLKPTGRIPVWVRVKIPAGVAPENYRFMVEVDAGNDVAESNGGGTGETNNTIGDSNTSVAVTAGDIDLSGAISDSKGTPDYDANQAVQAYRHMAVTNNGTVSTPSDGTVTLNIDIINDNTDVLQTTLVNNRILPNLGPGKSRTLLIDLLLPALAADNYRAEVTIVPDNFTDSVPGNDTFTFFFDMV